MPYTVEEYLRRGFHTSKEIQAETGLSQSTVTRKLKEMNDRIVSFRKNRRVRYATTRNAYGANDRLPLGVIDSKGRTTALGDIRPLAYGGVFIELGDRASTLYLGEGRNGVYDDLPYFLYDARPQGFLGRQIAGQISARHSEFPDDPKRWSNSHIGRYLISNGDDLPGNLVFGEQALLRIQRDPVSVTQEEYPVYADSVIKGEIPGSSAGGEQPKFAVFNGDSNTHVIVKFAPREAHDIAQRANDVLITEFHAAGILKSNGFLCANTRLLEMDRRLFLETERFDRHGTFGRSSMISLQSIDGEFAGVGHNWSRVTRVLYGLGMTSEMDALTAEVLGHFGQLINNTDMHLGNLSMAIEGDSFRLLPVYDMCSMGFAPRAGAELHPFAFEPSDIESRYLMDQELHEIKKMAHTFWENVTNDPRISDPFKAFLDQGNPVASLLSVE